VDWLNIESGMHECIREVSTETSGLRLRGEQVDVIAETMPKVESC
jgi:hypothetical protein